MERPAARGLVSRAVHLRPVRDLLARYLEHHPEDADRVARTLALVESRPDCLLRTCAPGHLTGSAWIVSHDRARVLLTHHRKLGRWLQLGGHADGEPDLLSVALREAHEESGIETFSLVPGARGTAPVDVDVHDIPARRDEPAHEHHDVRFLLIADADAVLRVSDESLALRWVAWDELESLAPDESLRRLAHRSRVLLKHSFR